jgi:hypothetical protein
MQYVICLRNPLEVARSLERRNGLTLGTGFELWLAYVQGSLEHTAGQPRMLIFYDDVLDDWRQELRRLAAFLDQPHRADQADVQRAVGDYVDAGLRHHRPGEAQHDLSIGCPAGSAAHRTYLLLRQKDVLALGEDETRIQEALNIIGQGANRQPRSVCVCSARSDSRVFER